ncbi:unnamed protein product [Candidula unifasciata]|uniref:Major facilitator superfamily (MFS) profile domain-containing protein n=1 Tax=Candidula unifasciata TaxID=100452 RepID=A0A8S3ZWX1_9EUPU|nr:unnamed protein product [Candidula unifasciata]
MKFDDVLAEVGEFGPYQKRLYHLLCLVGINAAFQVLSVIFTLAIPEHRCAIPDLLNDTYESQGDWHDVLAKQMIPWSNETQTFSKCTVFRRDEVSSFYTNETTGCNKWVYKKDPFQSTFITEDNLVCEKINLRTYANMIMMGGMMFGAIFMGSLSDLVGRKKVLMLGIVGNLGTSVALAFMTSYIPFVVVRVLIMIFGSGMFLTSFVIGLEIVGPSKRTIAGIVIEIYWVVGMFIMTGLAYGLRHWNHLQLALSVPSVFFLLYIFIIPESPRWLISKGRREEASKVIQRIARGNGVTLSEKTAALQEVELEGQGEKIWQMFTTPVLLIRCLVIFFNWTVASMVYYGLNLNVGSLYGDIYLNFFLSALVELAAYIVCLRFLDTPGRKPLQCAAMLTGGVACICTLFPVIYNAPGWVTVMMSLIGKFGASAAFAIIYVFSAELFPTVMRNSGMGLSSFSARIGGILAPFIADIGNVIEGDFAVALPLIIFGVVSIAAGLLALLLPETAYRKLPDTVEDAKQFGRDDIGGKNSYNLTKTDKEASPVTNGAVNRAFTLDEQNK